MKSCWGIRNEPSGPPAEANWIQTRAASRNGLDLDESHLCLRKWVGPGPFAYELSDFLVPLPFAYLAMHSTILKSTRPSWLF